ncbi:MAG: UvrB/UvrC motif-containing protein [Pirellula sp.]
MNQSDSSKTKVCLKCGQKLDGFASIMISTPGARAEPSCPRCAAEEHANSFESIEEADQFIEEINGILTSLANIIAKNPEMPEVPEGMEAGAMTPLSVYRTMQIHLAAFNSRRMEMLIEAGSDARIEYEINKAIKEEDYERAAELRNQKVGNRSVDSQ